MADFTRFFQDVSRARFKDFFAVFRYVLDVLEARFGCTLWCVLRTFCVYFGCIIGNFLNPYGGGRVFVIGDDIYADSR